MSHTQHTKFAVVGGLLLLCAITLSITEDNERLAFAQITPAPEKAGSSDDSSDGGSADGNDIGDDASSSDSSPPSSSNDDEVDDDGDVQDLTSSSMVEAIMNEVNEALSAAGIFGP